MFHITYFYRYSSKLRIIIILYAVHRVVLGDAGFFDYLPESL
jgi:hypothetical protein